MRTFSEFLSDRLATGGFTTEDVLVSALPLLRQVQETHAAGMVAPLDGIDSLRVEGAALWFEDAARVRPVENPATVRAFDPQPRGGVEVVGEHRVTLEVGDGSFELSDLRIGSSNEEITRPVYLPGFCSWDVAVGHHDPLADIFSLGLILASLGCGLDFRSREALQEFVASRHNLFDLSPSLHPVLAKAIVSMTELSRHKRPQDLRAVIRALENYRDQEVDFDFELARIRGFGEKDLQGKQEIVLGRLRERLFEISRRNRLLHFRDTSGTICLTEASVPLSFDPESIRPDQILTWGDKFAAELSRGERISLNRYLNLREALYAGPSLDRIRAEALRDQAEYGFQQLRLVACFLRWADVKATPPEHYLSPLVLLAVRLVKKKGVRDSFHLEPLSTVAELNPVVRHMLKQLYGIPLPETIDLAEANLDDLYQVLKNAVEGSDAGVTLKRVDRPRIDLIHQQARRRLELYHRRIRASGHGWRSFKDLDYSYDPANFQPLGLRIFNAWIRPAETQLRTVLQDSPRPRYYLSEAAGGTTSVRERKLYALHRGEERNPYEWEWDLCRVTLGNLRYRKMSLVRDYNELLAAPRENLAFDATFSLRPRVVETEACVAPPLEDRCDIVSCDPTQAAAIGMARKGISYIIQGPPGTGKSQTITNLITDFVARGKRVLFVCEKRAAIDVVHSRLSHKGLQELCCLIHDSQADKREFVMDLKRTYESFIQGALEGQNRKGRARDRLHELLKEQAQPLVDFAAAMRSTPEVAGTSVQNLLERAVELREADPGLAAVDLEHVPFYKEWLSGLQAVGALVDRLRDVQPDMVLSNHPLRLLSARLLEVERPTVLVSEVLDELRASAQALVEASRRVNPVLETSGTLAEALARAEFAAEASLLSRQSLIELVDPESDLSKRLTAGFEPYRTAAARVSSARETNSAWRAKLPRQEARQALEEAQRMERRVWRVFAPSWWRLRRVVGGRYDFAAHAIRPRLSTVLANLEAEYEAIEALGDQAQSLRESCAIREDLDETLACVEAARSRALQPSLQPWVESVLRGVRPNETMRELALLEPLLAGLVEALGDILDDFEDMPIGDLVDYLEMVGGSLERLPGFLNCLADLSSMPKNLARAFRTLALTPPELEAASLRRTLEEVFRHESCLRTVIGPQRERVSRRLLTGYQTWLDLNSALLREQARSRFVEHLRIASLPAAQLKKGEDEFKKRFNNGRRELEHEFGKTMRFKAIRDLVAGDSGTVVDDLKPIWLMSPLSVSDTLPLDVGRFDVVIFDEASQITLESAVPALFRASQAIVVGDEMQLPPTNFFSARLDDEASTVWLEDGETVIEYDLSLNSFLSHAAKNLPSRMLGWHYRSRAESLISFSNWAFYQGRLLTVPEETLGGLRRPAIEVGGPSEADGHAAEVLGRAVSFHFVKNTSYVKRRNRGEADYVARLVRALLSSKEGLSIGIVAFSEAQQDEIESALDRLGSEDPRFRARLEAELTREEDGQFTGLLVKNLENIQGDERDVIILSVCYGPDPDGRMRMNFGPINQIGGEKRLNVAFSRAKHHMVVVSSIHYGDITNDYNEGANCLKQYLRYAEACSVGDDHTSQRVLREMCLWRADEVAATSGATSVVAERLHEALARRGFVVERNVGMSDFRCDLAVRRSSDEAFGLGVLLDSGSYYRTDDVFEREVFRPRLLIDFGWRIARVLTSEWYEDPDAVLRRLVSILEGEAPAEVIDPDPEFATSLRSALDEAVALASSSPPPAPGEGAPGEAAVPSPSAPARGILDLAENTPRYFEYVGGGSKKFWEITLSGSRFSVRFGRIGTQGQERLKTLSSEASARNMARRLISEKLGKGYKETERPGKTPSAS